jgi:hypothetical protein
LALIVKPAFIGFYILVFSHTIKRRKAEIMRKRLVFVQRGKAEDTKALEDALKGHGWDLETVVLSRDEPLPRSFENIDGLLITGSDLNVYDQSVAPLAVY